MSVHRTSVSTIAMRPERADRPDQPDRPDRKDRSSANWRIPRPASSASSSAAVSSSSSSSSGPSSSSLFFKWNPAILRLAFVLSLVVYVFIPSRIIVRISEHPTFASVSHAGRRVLDSFNTPPSDNVPRSTVTTKAARPVPCADAPDGGVAIVAACMNRQDTLRKVLPTWLAVDGVSHIVIVDWGSMPPLRSIVRPKRDARVSLVRVYPEPAWVLSRAYNLAVNSTSCRHIVRTDCDYELSSDLLLAHDLNRTRRAFYTGNWHMARDENEAHLNGAMVMRRDAFVGVGGYDERIQTYGWDDEDLYNRLSAANLTKLNVSYDHVSHHAHDDSKRKQNGVKFAHVQIDVNQLLLDKLPVWSRRMKEGKDGSLYRTLNLEDDGSNGHYTELQAVHVPSALQRRVSKVDYDIVWSLALGRRLADDHGVPWDVQSSMTPPVRETLLRQLQLLQHRLDSLARNGTERMPVANGKMVLLPTRARLVIVHCMHGLGNRLRALGSGLAFAENSMRVPVVVWERDVHIAAEFSELFESVDELVVLDSFAPKWPFDKLHQYDKAWNAFDFYNYMEMETGGKKGELIINKADKHLYYKGAYVMEAPDYSWWEADNTQLRTALKPVAMIQQALTKLQDEGISDAIGVHIRNRTLEQDIKDVDSMSEYGEAATRELERWRSRSCYETFVVELERMVAENDKAKFYIATDTWKVVDIMEQRFPGRILSTPRSCDDRDTECVRFAVIDLYALSATKELLGSNWSSYTELAERLGDLKARLAGRDFGTSRQQDSVDGNANNNNMGAAKVNGRGSSKAVVGN